MRKRPTEKLKIHINIYNIYLVGYLIYIMILNNHVEQKY